MVTVQRPESPIILICLSPNCSEISGNRTGDKLMIFDTEGHSVRQDKRSMTFSISLVMIFDRPDGVV